MSNEKKTISNKTIAKEDIIAAIKECAQNLGRAAQIR